MARTRIDLQPAKNVHLVLFEELTYGHYAFFDGICGEHGTENDAHNQRNVAARALRHFFDRYF